MDILVINMKIVDIKIRAMWREYSMRCMSESIHSLNSWNYNMFNFITTIKSSILKSVKTQAFMRNTSIPSANEHIFCIMSASAAAAE